jgi:hypothetical protein
MKFRESFYVNGQYDHRIVSQGNTRLELIKNCKLIKKHGYKTIKETKFSDMTRLEQVKIIVFFHKFSDVNNLGV